MDLREYLKSIGRLKENEPEETPETTGRPLTVGEVFDMMKATDPEKLPKNFYGANAGRWKTQIVAPGCN